MCTRGFPMGFNEGQALRVELRLLVASTAPNLLLPWRAQPPVLHRMCRWARQTADAQGGSQPSRRTEEPSQHHARHHLQMHGLQASGCRRAQSLRHALCRPCQYALIFSSCAVRDGTKRTGSRRFSRCTPLPACRPAASRNIPSQLSSCGRWAKGQRPTGRRHSQAGTPRPPLRTVAALGPRGPRRERGPAGRSWGRRHQPREKVPHRRPLTARTSNTEWW